MSASAFTLTVILIIFLATIGLFGALAIVSGMRDEDRRDADQ